MHTGLEYTNSGVQNIRAILTLMALTGNLDQPGGMLFRTGRPPQLRRNRISPPEARPAIGSARYPLFCDLNKSGHFMEAPRAILEGNPYPLRGLIVLGRVDHHGLPDPNLWRRCCEALDALIVIDRFLTNEALYADIVLPATTMYEITSYRRYPRSHFLSREDHPACRRVEK